MKFDIFLITDFSNDDILNRPTKPYDVYSKNQPRNRKPCNEEGFRMYFIFSSGKRFSVLPSFP